MAEDEPKPSIQALIDAIQKLWRLFHPPAIGVLTLLAIVFILIGPFDPIGRAIDYQGVPSDTGLERLDRLGLKPVLPALVLALLLLGLQVIREFVQSLGGLIPPFIVVRWENLFQAFLGLDKMARAWSDYDEVEDLDALDAVIDRELDPLKGRQGIALHEQIAEWNTSMLGLSWWIMYCKLCLYAIPIVALLGVARLGRPPAAVVFRAVLLESLVVVVYGFIASRFLHIVQQHTASRIICWEAFRAKRGSAPDETRLAKRREELEKTSHGRWWGLSIRSPIRTGRVSVLLGQRFKKEELSDLKGGRSV